MYIAFSIIEVFLFMQVVLEQYFMQKAFDFTNFSRLDFEDLVESPADDNCITEQEDFSLVPSVQEEIQQPRAEVTKLDDGAKQLLSSIEQEFSEHYTEAFITPSDDDCPPINVDEADCLSIGDINESNEQSKPDHSFSKYPSTKIKEKLEGQQKWIATVIGKEGNYLHINDGSRIWAKFNGKVTSPVNINDVLLMDVTKAGRSVTIDHFITLDTGVSNDYKIPDEDLYVEMEEAI